MDDNNKIYNEIKEELDENLGKPEDDMFLEAIMGKEEIPVEAVAAMWPNTTMSEFLQEMERHGMKVIISKKKQEAPTPTPEEIENVHLVSEMEDTPENRERYLKMREMAREKLGESSIVEAFLENDPVDRDSALDEGALENLNTASYQGNFGELKELSQKLKEKTE